MSADRETSANIWIQRASRRGAQYAFFVAKIAAPRRDGPAALFVSGSQLSGQDGEGSVMLLLPKMFLNDGKEIPQLGFGTWQVPDEPTVMIEALRSGYRLVDTAPAYGNEASVGEAVRSSRIPREALFVTTKLNNPDHGYDNTLRAFDASLARLGLDYLDLYLIHWPKPALDLYAESWRAFVRLREEGRVKSIGVSNFNVEHLQRIIDETGVVPVVNQVELHPRFQQNGIRDFAKKHGIVVQSWSPLGRGHLTDNSIIAGLAEQYGKSWAQIIIRWHLQSGLALIPRSTSSTNLRSNLNVFDFALSDEDMAQMTELDDRQGRIGHDPSTF
jgi:2,5-diketo-D-gluconate reductase A